MCVEVIICYVSVIFIRHSVEGLDNLVYHSAILQGMLFAMTTNFWSKFGFCCDIPSFVMLALWNGLQCILCLSSNYKRLNSMNFSTLCRNLLSLGPVTRVYAVKNDNFAAIRQKSAYHAKYLGISWTELYQLSGLVGIWVGMIIVPFV